MARYLKIFFVTLLAIFALSQSTACYYFFTLMESKSEISNHRMYEIREFPKDLRCGLVRYWTKNNLPPDGGILILGDSQTFGFNAKDLNIFSYLLQRDRRSMSIKNASIVDGHFDDANNVLGILKNNKIKLKDIVINVDPAHFKDQYVVPRHLTTSECNIPGLIDIFGSRELLSSMETIAIQNFRNPNEKEPWRLREKDADPLPPEIMDGPLPEDYITEVNNPKYEDDFFSFLTSARGIANTTIVYMSPMQLYKKHPEAQFNIRKRYMELCRSFRLKNGGVLCIDPSEDFEKADFVDIIHLNSSGHKKMAALLAPLLFGVKQPKTGQSAKISP